jgi:prepilin-type N-terminal cleavage/methylation domain-containing protein
VAVAAENVMDFAAGFTAIEVVVAVAIAVAADVIEG